MLEVVQQQQELLLAQIGREMPQGGAISALRQTECVYDRGDDQVGVANGDQRDETGALVKLLQQLGPKRQGESRLADPRSAGECHQPHLRTRQPGTRCLEFLLAPDQGGERHGQILNVCWCVPQRRAGCVCFDCRSC